VLLFQRAFWVGSTDHPDQTEADHLPDHLFIWGFKMIAVSLVILFIAQKVFSRLESKIPERI
jgi:ABC-2 type transport system permease protein